MNPRQPTKESHLNSSHKIGFNVEDNYEVALTLPKVWVRASNEDGSERWFWYAEKQRKT